MNVPRLSSTVLGGDLGDLEVEHGWSSFAFAVRVGARPGVRSSVLLRVQLDDELLLDRRGDLRALGQAQHLGGERVVVGLQPGRHRRRSARSRRGSTCSAPELGLDRDHVVGLAPGSDGMSTRRPLIGQWPWRISWRAWRREAAKPRRTSTLSKRRSSRRSRFSPVTPGLARGLVVVVAELLLEHAVVAARLLLLAQLDAVLGLARAAAAVVARRVGAALDAALVGQAALALEEQLLALAAALLALGAGVASHARPCRRLRGRQPLWACGVTSLTPVTSSPAACSERIAVSRPEPGPLTKTSTFSGRAPCPCGRRRRPSPARRTASTCASP